MKRDSTRLTGLPQKTLAAGLKRLEQAGITQERWLAMLDADAAAMRRLAAAWPDAPAGTIVYDAGAVSRILGIPAECSDPVPQAGDGEIVVRASARRLAVLVTRRRPSSAGAAASSEL